MNVFLKKIGVGILFVIFICVKSEAVKDFKLVKTIKPEQEKDIYGCYNENVSIVGITPDGKFLICRWLEFLHGFNFFSLDTSFIEIRDIRDGVTSESFGKVIKTINPGDRCNSWITPQGNLFLHGEPQNWARLVDIDIMSKEESKMTDMGNVCHPSEFMSDLLISTDYNEGAIFVYEMNPIAAQLGKELGRISDPNNDVSLLAVAQKRKLLFVGQKDGKIKIFNMDRSSKDKKLLEKITEFVSHTLPIQSLTVTPDEKYLISCHDTGRAKMGDRNAEIKMWNIHDIISKKSDLKETLLLTGQGMDGIPPHITVTPNGKLLITQDNIYSSANTTIKIFNIDDSFDSFGKKILEQNIGCRLNKGLFFTKDSRFLIAVTVARGIHCWQLPQPSKPSSFIAKDNILPYKQPGFKFPKLNDIKISFGKKSDEVKKVVEKKDPLVTTLDLVDLLDTLRGYAHDQQELLVQENNALLENNAEKTNMPFIELIVSLENFFSYTTTLVDTFPINKMGITNFIKNKCLETIQKSLERTIKIYSLYGVQNTFLANKSKSIQEELHKRTKNLLNAYALFTKKAGKNPLGLNVLIKDLETTYDQYVKKSFTYSFSN